MGVADSGGSDDDGSARFGRSVVRRLARDEFLNSRWICDWVDWFNVLPDCDYQARGEI